MKSVTSSSSIKISEHTREFDDTIESCLVDCAKCTGAYHSKGISWHILCMCSCHDTISSRGAGDKNEQQRFGQLPR